MSSYLLHHHHKPEKCGVAFAAFKGHGSTLRKAETLASCASGGHEIWWVVEAASAEAALDLLPHYVAQRSTVAQVQRLRIP